MNFRKVSKEGGHALFLVNSEMDSDLFKIG